MSEWLVAMWRERVSRMPHQRNWTYLGIGGLVLAVSIVGFFPFYAKLLRPAQEMTNGYAHGLMMTAWCVMFIVQAGLIRARFVRAHKILGVLVTLLFVIAVVDSIDTAFTGVRSNPDSFQAPASPFLIFLLGNLFQFATLAFAGLTMRRQPSFHRRLMLSSTASLLPAGLIRIDWPPLYFAFPLAPVLLTNLVVVWIAFIDRQKTGRLHPSYIWALLFLVATEIICFAAATSHTLLGLLDKFVRPT